VLQTKGVKYPLLDVQCSAVSRRGLLVDLGLLEKQRDVENKVLKDDGRLMSYHNARWAIPLAHPSINNPAEYMSLNPEKSETPSNEQTSMLAVTGPFIWTTYLTRLTGRNVKSSLSLFRRIPSNGILTAFRPHAYPDQVRGDLDITVMFNGIVLSRTEHNKSNYASPNCCGHIAQNQCVFFGVRKF
jgi:hypothetical protein